MDSYKIRVAVAAAVLAMYNALPVLKRTGLFQ